MDTNEDEKRIEMDTECRNCVTPACRYKGTPGYLPGCPKDPHTQAYLEAFRRRYNGKAQD